MTFSHLVQIGLPFLWAGVSLSGNLVAAPAKFRVEALEMPIALQVGRAQFTWIGYVEWVLLGLIVAGLLVRMKLPAVYLAFAILVFLVQQLWMQPLLEARTNIIVAGGNVGDSHFHLYFIAAEFAKFLALLMAGYMAMTAAFLQGKVG